MTHDTSAHGAGLSAGWAGTGHERAGVWDRAGWPRIAGGVPPLQLLALSIIIGVAWGVLLASAGHAGEALGLPLAALSAAGAVAVVVGACCRRRNPPHPPAEPAAPLPSEPSRLLAQMHHELRTPLNAVIGFSEAMQHELHGPLGNARYQEYAAHISASGGLLLKASEDAIAVASSMSALLAGIAASGRMPRRDRLPLAGLLQEAWEALGAGPRGVRLDVSGCGDAEIDCHWQIMSQALRHLLSELAAGVAPAGTVVAGSIRRGGVDCIEIIGLPAHDPAPSARRSAAGPADGLCLMLARSLVELQGAALEVISRAPGAPWSARITLPAAQAPAARPWRRPALTASRPPAPPARRAGSAASAAARASAYRHAAPAA